MNLLKTRFFGLAVLLSTVSALLGVTPSLTPAAQASPTAPEVEGTYRISFGDHRGALFNLLQSRPGGWIAGLCDWRLGSCYAYFDVRYEAENNQFIGFESSADPESPHFDIIRFQISGAAIHGDRPLYSGGSEMGNFTGFRTEGYTNYLEQLSEESQSVVGTYEGEFEFNPHPAAVAGDIPPASENLRQEARLSIQFFNGRLIGNLLIGTDPVTSVALPNGLEQENGGVVYLTSNRTMARSWTHLRGVLQPGGYLFGQYILGGRGLAVSRFALKKVR